MVKELDLFESNHGCWLNALSREDIRNGRNTTLHGPELARNVFPKPFGAGRAITHGFSTFESFDLMGIAQVLFGLSIARLGLALGYAIIVGLGALLGTLVPLFVKNREVIGTGRGALILSGVAIMVLGLAVSARAGKAREGSGVSAAGGSYAAALAVAVLCGLMAPMLNYAFAFGQSIADEAVRQGASPQTASYAVWPIALLGGLIPNAGYSFWLLSRNGTWKHFRDTWRPDVWFGCLMGVLWMGAFAIYGVSSVYLGTLGTSVGWALFQIFMIMTANLSGVLTGEWKDAPAPAKRGMWTGLALLTVATVAIAASNR
jgi:L-rhamnose-H+ transport protein